MKTVISLAEIKEIIPHRYPFLMIDKIVEMVPDKYAIGIKNVTVNEPFFQGHFPDRPVMPGVMIMEAVAQTAAVWAKRSQFGIEPDYYLYLVGVKEFRWKKQVIPGDTLSIRVEFQKRKKPMLVIKAEVTVDGEFVGGGILSAAEGE